MAKKDLDDTLEQLRQENRQLKQVIRSLQKAIKKLSKGKDRLEDLEKLFQEVSLEQDFKEPPKLGGCPNCTKGAIELIDMKVRVMYKCNYCNYSKIVKK